MTDLDRFRAEAREWLLANAPKSMFTLPRSEEDVCPGGKTVQFPPDVAQWLKVMGERGWTAPTWPKEYGGGGLSPAEGKALQEEMRALKLRPALAGFGLTMIGPLLLHEASDEIKREHLPRIVRGEVRWCQGYSEPGAGSDLAGLQTRAVPDGDDFVVNGQKIWTSYGHRADWIFCLVRSEPDKPKHDGISFLLIDMKTPGVKASPLRLISGNEHFSQVFFDDVRVPKENIVGVQGRGWDVAKYLMLFERQMIGAMRAVGPMRLSEFALKHLGQEGLRAEPVLRARVAELDLEFAAFEALVARYGEEAAAGEQVGAKSSMLKYFGTELTVKKQELMLSILGAAGLDRDGPEAKTATDWLGALANRIGGGTSEIQLNVVAKRVLELPGG